ncbi:restriction endonuclease subunit S [Mycoplasma sp. SK341A]|uniref:restriction endonuclease subunit S n=1 Tax=Mycoplasma sp. SK341A TaxID=3401679 RepID=UPI003AAFD17D
MQKDKLVPDVRFKGFEEEWKTNRLCEVALKFDNLRIPVSESLRIKGPYPYYGANGVQDYVSGFTHNGEFVLIAEDGANDLDSYPSNYVNGKFWANNHVHVLQGFKDTLDNKFLNYSFTNVSFKPLLTGGDRAKLTAGALDTINIKVPIFNEQRKIGSLLNNIDQLLLSQKSKLEKLQIIKQSLLNKMFASDNQKMPEIRFQGFKNNWNNKEIGSFGDWLAGTSLENQFCTSGTHKVVNIGSFGPDFKYNDQGLHINLNNENKRFLLDKDDLVMILNDKTLEGRIIGSVLLIDKDNTYLYNQRIQRLSINKAQYDSNYLFFLINNMRNHDILYKKSQGNTQIYLNWSVVSKINFLVSEQLDEQQKIGQFFSSLDSLIHSQEQKLEKLNNIKQALLEKMFC